MAIPQLMFKIWDGDSDEYFTHIDMNRLEYNANILAKKTTGVSEVTFISVTRASQFRYDEAQKLENLIKALADANGVSVAIETAWGYNRTVSYVDFERWESNLYAVYQAMGGVGDRIPAGKVQVVVSDTLYASDWSASYPYYQDLDIPMYHAGNEYQTWVSHTATEDQRQAEFIGRLWMVPVSDMVIRVYALGHRPKVDIPIRIMKGVMKMHEEVTISSSSWSGSGPYTATVSLTNTPTDAILGVHDGMTQAQVVAFADAKIYVSGISGSTLTLKALGTKPTINLKPIVAWNESEVA